jgi:hypothetical protein
MRPFWEEKTMESRRSVSEPDTSGTIDKFRTMVGAAGFEPTTTRTPSECATGLRYAPTL